MEEQDITSFEPLIICKDNTVNIKMIDRWVKVTKSKIEYIK